MSRSSFSKDIRSIGALVESDLDPAECHHAAAVLRMLANLASYVGRAKRARKMGAIAHALEYERHAERIYNSLPEPYRW